MYRKIMKKGPKKSPKEIRPKQDTEEEPNRLYAHARHLSFRRGRRIQDPSRSILKIDDVNSKKDTEFYIGKEVQLVYYPKTVFNGVEKRIVKGKILKAHGLSGAVLSKFERNLPAFTFGSLIRVMLYNSDL